MNTTKLMRFAVTGQYKSGRKSTMHIYAASQYAAMRLVEANQRKQGVNFCAYAARATN